MITLLAGAEQAAGAIMRVPEDHSTIQGAIDAAAENDTVLVSPGTYVERIDFRVKQITVESSAGADSTVIDGGGGGAVVTMEAYDGKAPVLRGFTVTNGGAEGFSDGGIDTVGGPALIEHNKVTGNVLCFDAAIDALASHATIRNNLVSDNTQTNLCSGGGGGGVSLSGFGAAKVLHNVIERNGQAFDGGGVYLFASGDPIIDGNVISDNDAYNEGGGMYIVNRSDALIANNVITGNRAAEGGGVFWLVPSDERGPLLVNNTIASNEADVGLAVLADGYDVRARIVNNVLHGEGAAAVLHCGDFNDRNNPVIAFNDVFNTGAGSRYGGLCGDLTGVSGNISADPLFVDAAGGDYRLQDGSPAIDAGTDDGTPASDIEGTPRPQDGDGDGAARTDMGAYEFPAPNRAPDCSGVVATPSVLSPANRRMRPVSLSGATDPDGDTVRIAIETVTQDEPVTGRGDRTAPDATLSSDAGRVSVRAERRAGGDGRVYRIGFTASDGKGGSCVGTATVSVPRQAGVPAIDSAPPSFNSLQP